MSSNGHGSPSGTPSGRSRSDLPSISLIMGIAAIPVALLTIVGGVIVAGVAIAVGRQALVQARRGGNVERRIAIAGIATGGAGLLLSIVSGILFLVGGF